jgi:hypothetical protein
MLEGFAIVGGSVPVRDWSVRGLVLGAYGLSLAPEATPASSAQVQAPSDTVRASAEVWADMPGPLAVELGGHAVQRLSGVDLDSEWVDEWFGTSLDRWNVLQYGAIAVSGKVSVDLSAHSGLHVGASRVVAVDNGASNTTDVSVGWHRYFAP